MARAFRLTPIEAPEHSIQDAVLRYLSLDRRVAWAHRFNTGAQLIEGRDARGQKTRRFIRYAFPGCSDVLGQLVTGQFLAVEVKRPSTRPTPEQKAFLDQVEAANGLSLVARRVEDVQRALDEFYRNADSGLTCERGLERVAW